MVGACEESRVGRTMVERVPSHIFARAPGPATPVVDDSVLVLAAQQDGRAFAALYDRYLDRIYRYSYRCLGNREAAEDATSLIFSRALASLKRCNPRTFRPWLFAIAHNAITDAATDRRPTDILDFASKLV